jgi:polysaccharide biosynthesis/export protein
MKIIIKWLLPFCFIVGAAHAEDYVIGEGDVLNVHVWGEDALNVQSNVRPDGKITVPGLGEISAAGKTPVQLQENLSNDLKKLVKYSPVVTVSVTEITNSNAFVFGGGVPSRVVHLNQRTTLLHLLTSLGESGEPSVERTTEERTGAGTTRADFRRAYVLRDGKKIKEDFRGLFVQGDTSQDVLLKAGDIIFIPAMLEQNVYVLGGVETPRAIPFREGMSVIEAILEAGGFNKFANENRTVIIRKQEAEIETIPVRAKDLFSKGDLEQNIPLQLGDYVIVREGIF